MWFVEFNKFFKARIFDRNESRVGFDGAKWSVLNRNIEVGEEIESAAFAYVGHSKKAHLERSARSP